MSSTSPLGQNQQLSPAEQQLLQQLVSASGSYGNFDPSAQAQQQNPYATQTPYADLTSQDTAAFQTAAAAGQPGQASGGAPGQAPDAAAAAGGAAMDPSAMMSLDPSAAGGPGGQQPAPGGSGKALGLGAALLGGAYAGGVALTTHRANGAIREAAEAAGKAVTEKAKMVLNPLKFFSKKENLLDVAKKDIAEAAADSASDVAAKTASSFSFSADHAKDIVSNAGTLKASIGKLRSGDAEGLKELDKFLAEVPAGGSETSKFSRSFVNLAKGLREFEKDGTTASPEIQKAAKEMLDSLVASLDKDAPTVVNAQANALYRLKAISLQGTSVAHTLPANTVTKVMDRIHTAGLPEGKSAIDRIVRDGYTGTPEELAGGVIKDHLAAQAKQDAPDVRNLLSNLLEDGSGNPSAIAGLNANGIELDTLRAPLRYITGVTGDTSKDLQRKALVGEFSRAFQSGNAGELHLANARRSLHALDGTEDLAKMVADRRTALAADTTAALPSVSADVTATRGSHAYAEKVLKEFFEALEVGDRAALMKADKIAAAIRGAHFTPGIGSTSHPTGGALDSIVSI